MTPKHNPGALPPPSTLSPSEFSLDVSSTLDGATDSEAFALLDADAQKKAIRTRPPTVKPLVEPIQQPGGVEVKEVGWSQFAALASVNDLPADPKTS